MNTEYLTFGLEMAVVGFAVVFVTLYLLCLIMFGFNYIFAPKKVAPIPKSKEEAEPLQKTTSYLEEERGSNRKIAAAITGAIAVCLSKAESQFIIKRVGVAEQKVSNNWLLTSRKVAVEQNQELFMLRRERKR